ncbi:hypothetical protein V8G54_024931 [Vigna mungo]|uniref:Uncharacterized protein n=1 Tax=Vigna mungo TaxID=3915 RepID=A0AAQ3N644_VIGMU
MTVVREFFLPPERNRFGLVSNRSMLSSLGVGDYGPWFVVQYQAGCSSCSNILKEEDDLNHVLQMNNYYVKEVMIKSPFYQQISHLYFYLLIDHPNPQKLGEKVRKLLKLLENWHNIIIVRIKQVRRKMSVLINVIMV